MSITIWKLKPNTLVDKDGKFVGGTESAQEKYQAGLDYIERLKVEYPNLTWKQEEDKLIIEIDGE